MVGRPSLPSAGHLPPRPARARSEASPHPRESGNDDSICPDDAGTHTLKGGSLPRATCCSLSAPGGGEGWGEVGIPERSPRDPPHPPTPPARAPPSPP